MLDLMGRCRASRGWRGFYVQKSLRAMTMRTDFPVVRISRFQNAPELRSTRPASRPLNES
jgi:hypothetical protein